MSKNEDNPGNLTPDKEITLPKGEYYGNMEVFNEIKITKLDADDKRINQIVSLPKGSYLISKEEQGFVVSGIDIKLSFE